ncbi:Hypothetical protein A7982_04232 [Minicystis rosea]|nr:Hypothetical protein A7982_04232 [Minicystis rosea]
MSDLRAPLRRIADVPIDETTLQHMWRAIGKRRAHRQVSASFGKIRVAFALAACVALALALIVRFAVHRDVGPLHQAGGAELGDIDGSAFHAGASASASRRIELDDGSSLVVEAGTRMKTLSNTSSSLITLLEGGRVTFDIRPGGPRRWIIECGLATVEVVGTRFTVDRAPHHGRVTVERGVVLVRGELVKDRIQRLTAGESLEIEDGAAEAPAPAPPSAVASSAPASSAAAPLATSTVKVTPSAPTDEAREPWRELARKGAFKEAYRAIAPAGIAQQATTASVDDLLLLADVARLSGHSIEAVAPLMRVMNEKSGDPRAPMAAFTLGRVQLDALGQAPAAAQTFARAIAMGLPQGLREDAHARVVEARARAGDSAGARAAAAEYEARYPNGGRLAEVRAWAERE